MSDDDNEEPPIAPEEISNNDPSDQHPVIDARYAEALFRQREVKRRLAVTPRRRPILRLVWDKDAAE